MSAPSWKKVTPTPYWDPEPGETITGRFVGIFEREGVHGVYRVVSLSTEHGDIRITGTALISALEGVTENETLQITYRGTIGTTSGHRVKQFDVFVAE